MGKVLWDTLYYSWCMLYGLFCMLFMTWSWTSYLQVVNKLLLWLNLLFQISKSWTSGEQVKSKLWTSYEQFITSCGKVLKKSLTWAEQVLKNCEQVVNKYCSNELVNNKQWTSPVQVLNKSLTICEQVMSNSWTTHEQELDMNKSWTNEAY